MPFFPIFTLDGAKATKPQSIIFYTLATQADLAMKQSYKETMAILLTKLINKNYY